MHRQAKVFLWLASMAVGVFAALISSSASSQEADLAAHAQYVRHDVRAYVMGTSRPIAKGDAIMRDEIVRTSVDSSALLRLRNGSLLSMGPLSQIKLDDFAIGEDRSLTLSIVSGFFRILSGPKKPGEARRYNVQTPHAMIGVRGTTFDLEIEQGRTTVVLHEGAVQVCSQKKTCADLQPGSGIEVTLDGLGHVRPATSIGWNFWESQVPSGQRKALLAHVPDAAKDDEPPRPHRSLRPVIPDLAASAADRPRDNRPIPMKVESRTGWITAGP